MTRLSRPAVVASGVLLMATSVWVAGQCLLAAHFGEQSWATVQRAEARRAAQAAARRLSEHAPMFARSETTAAYWFPLVQATTVVVVALSALALLFVVVGRRRTWIGLGVPVFVHPVLTEPPSSWLRPLGQFWSGPWVHAADSEIPVLLPRVGTAVDLLVVALPAVAYLLMTRTADRPQVLPARQLALRLAAPLTLLAGGLVLYGSAYAEGSNLDTVLLPLAVLAAAGLLATTRAGALTAAAVVAGAATVVSGEVAGGIPLVVTGRGAADFWETVGGNLWPFAVLAVVGAVCGAHGAQIAAVYRRLVRRGPAVRAAEAAL